MRAVTRQAVFLNRGMLEKKGPPLIGMAAPALNVHRFVFNHGVTLGSMRIVAARAGDLALHDGMMGRFIDLHPHLLMTADTGFVFQLSSGCCEGTDSRIPLCNGYR